MRLPRLLKLLSLLRREPFQSLQKVVERLAFEHVDTYVFLFLFLGAQYVFGLFIPTLEQYFLPSVFWAFNSISRTMFASWCFWAFILIEYVYVYLFTFLFSLVCSSLCLTLFVRM